MGKKNKNGKEAVFMSWLLNWTADDVSWWGNAWIIASLVAGVVSTFAVIWSGNIKEVALKRELAASAERTAGLEKDAADARLELEKIKERQTPRIITPEQRETALATLNTANKGEIQIMAVTNDAETCGYAEQIRRLLQEAGFGVPYSIGVGINSGVPPQGLGLITKDSNEPPPQMVSVANALQQANIAFVVQSNPGMSDGLFLIEVGIKPIAP